MIESTFVNAEELRTKSVRTWTGADWSEPRVITDLRGTPKGDRAEVWELDRLVPPTRGNGHRRRQYLKIMHCAEGWHSASGADDCPMGPEVCAALGDAKWTRGARNWRDEFRAFHLEHPVVWVIRERISGTTRMHRYCDAELPDDLRLVTPSARCSMAGREVK